MHACYFYHEHIYQTWLNNIICRKTHQLPNSNNNHNNTGIKSVQNLRKMDAQVRTSIYLKAEILAECTNIWMLCNEISFCDWIFHCWPQWKRDSGPLIVYECNRPAQNFRVIKKLRATDCFWIIWGKFDGITRSASARAIAIFLWDGFWHFTVSLANLIYSRTGVSNLNFWMKAIVWGN